MMITGHASEYGEDFAEYMWHDLGSGGGTSQHSPFFDTSIRDCTAQNSNCNQSYPDIVWEVGVLDACGQARDTDLWFCVGGEA
jgi:hypothetical protein